MIWDTHETVQGVVTPVTSRPRMRQFPDTGL